MNTTIDFTDFSGETTTYEVAFTAANGDRIVFEAWPKLSMADDTGKADPIVLVFGLEGRLEARIKLSTWTYIHGDAEINVMNTQQKREEWAKFFDASAKWHNTLGCMAFDEAVEIRKRETGSTAHNPHREASAEEKEKLEQAYEWWRKSREIANMARSYRSAYAQSNNSEKDKTS